MNKLLPQCLAAISNGDTPSITANWIGSNMYEHVGTVLHFGGRACRSDCQTRVDVKKIQMELNSRCPKF